MTSQSTKPCLVCGATTTNRCANCTQAGIDLRFCSREHQTLVWPVHKLVCGAGKADPFLWPKLTAKEADDAIQHQDVLVFDTISISMFLQGQGVPAHEVADKIRSLSDLTPHCTAQELPLEQLFLANIRLLEEERSFLPQRTPGEPEFAVKVLRSMTSWVGKLDGDFLASTTLPTGRAPFLHRVLVYYVLAFTPRGGEARAMSGKAWAQVADCFNKELQPANRAEAEQLMRVMGEVAEDEAALATRVWEILRGR